MQIGTIPVRKISEAHIFEHAHFALFKIKLQI